MMWSTIANLKENLNKIAHDVHDDSDELEICSPSNGRGSDRRLSNSFAHSNLLSASPLSNGLDPPYNSEIEQFKAEIKRLQESEAEIKALSINYAALLKEKEDRIIRLNEENGSLKQNLEAINAAMSTSRNENFKLSASSGNALKGTGDQSPTRQHKLDSQVKNRSTGNQTHNDIAVKQDGLSNGIKDIRFDASQANMESELLNMMGKEKELADLLEERNRFLVAAQSTHELQMKQLKMELEKERDKSANVLEKFEEEHQWNESLREELKSLRMDKEKTFLETSKIHDELNEKLSEIRRLQMELNRREGEGADDVTEKLKRVIATLEKENANLKMEKNELQSSLKLSRNSSTSPTTLENSNKHKSSLDETLYLSGGFPGKERFEQSLQKLEKDLKDACREKDKALQELARLKQHLLEKESEESEKMDEDSKIIEDLRANSEIQRAQILNLEKALKQAIASQEDVRMANTNELQKCKELIDVLNKKVSNLMATIDAKNVELLNLQTALGQYYAEIEARERVERDFSLAKEESARLSELLKDANQKLGISDREKEDILAKLSETEKMVVEGKAKARVSKLEEDNAKLRRAVEQSMTRLNRMSLDSDYLVDRRIVIKLLVTYFQRNHSKEVLDLMVRMLGFSEEDKQRIGVAQQGSGKGVVRGVLGIPGRLVGILGGSSPDAHGNSAPESESFADLWVDFLLKETEEREKREAFEGGGGPNKDTKATPPMPDQRAPMEGLAPSFQRANQNPREMHSEHSDSEFSTVHLTSSESNTRISKLLPRY